VLFLGCGCGGVCVVCGVVVVWLWGVRGGGVLGGGGGWGGGGGGGGGVDLAAPSRLHQSSALPCE